MWSLCLLFSITLVLKVSSMDLQIFRAQLKVEHLLVVWFSKILFFWKGTGLIPTIKNQNFLKLIDIF